MYTILSYIIAILILSVNTSYASMAENVDHKIIFLTKDKWVCVRDLKTDSTIKVFSLSQFPTTEKKWPYINNIEAKWINNTAIEIIIVGGCWGAPFTSTPDCAVIVRYDYVKKILIHQEYYIFKVYGPPIIVEYGMYMPLPWEQHGIILDDKSNRKFKTEVNGKFSDYLFYEPQKTECINNKFYFAYSSTALAEASCDLYDSSERIQYDQLDRKIEFLPRTTFSDGTGACHKFCTTGFKGLYASKNKQFVAATFYKQKSLFSWKKESISEIVEYDITTSRFKTILDSSRNPRYSNDDEFILYEKGYKPFGYKLFTSQGYYILNRNTKESTYVGDYEFAVFVQ